MTSLLQNILLIFSIIGGIISLIVGVVKHRKIFLIAASGFLMLVGSVVMLGYIADAPNIYTYPKDKVGMALPTGICFLIAGFIDLMLVIQMDFKNKIEQAREEGRQEERKKQSKSL